MDRIKKGNYKAVFTDIDGTLLNTSHQVPKASKERIRQLDGQGIPFVLVSARMPKGMIGIRDEIGVRAPMVCYSGALVVDADGRAMASSVLDEKETKALCMYIKQEEPEVSLNLYYEDSWMVEDKKEYWVKQEMDITQIEADEIPFTDEGFSRKTHKILCMGEADQIDRLEKNLVQEFPEIRIYKSKDTYLEIMSMSASKSAAIRILEDIFSVQREEIIAFGDGHNDIDMLQYAGLGVAMGNASVEVKEAADIVTKRNDEEGLRYILDRAF